MGKLIIEIKDKKKDKKDNKKNEGFVIMFFIFGILLLILRPFESDSYAELIVKIITLILAIVAGYFGYKRGKYGVKNKKREKIVSTIILVIAGIMFLFLLIGILLISGCVQKREYVCLNGDIVDSPDLCQSTTTTDQDSLMENCMKSFDECIEINKIKFDISTSIIKSEKFSEMEEANNFFKIWAAFIQPDLATELNLNNKPSKEHFPLVLFAVKLKIPEGQSTLVLICDNTGKLIDFSKIRMSCG